MILATATGHNKSKPQWHRVERGAQLTLTSQMDHAKVNSML